MNRSFLAALATLLLLSGACGRGEPATTADTTTKTTPEAQSLLGKALYPRTITPETRARLEQNLAAAQKAYEHTPTNADSIIWLGRRLAYLERYQDAIRVFSDGVAKHPNDARMYRHRGHRYITVREFDKAIADLDRAATLVRGTPDEMEPDGAPNARNIPTSTSQGNIYYHLALARYLKGDYAKSLAAWQEAMKLAKNDDTRVAVADWTYMTLRRLGRDDDAKRVLAPITRDMNVIENTAYHRRLLMYKGEISPDSLLAPGSTDELQFVTQGYGVANWYLANGDKARADAVLDQLLSGSYWAAFGYIAAEADVARNRKA
jgi:tetratricopeptide (TPR) repeat protein